MSMSYDLKKWLIDNKFGKFAKKLYQFGIESMNDLRLLITEDIIEDLCGKNGIKMTIIYRRKFIKKVLEYNKSNNNRRGSQSGDLDEFGSLLMQSISKKSIEHKYKFKYEMEAVNQLTKRIQQTTKSIRITKKLQSEIEQQTKIVKENIVSDFDELIRIIAMRKKEILSAIDTKQKITIDRLDEQYKNICETAKTLLITQQSVSPQIRESEPSQERKQDIIEQIESCFEECDKYTPLNYSYVTKNDIKYENGNAKDCKYYGKLIYNDEQLV